MKIVIYEDNWHAVRERYAQFLLNHDIQVYLKSPLEKAFLRGKNYLVSHGFKVENIHFGIPEEVPSADIYFCDGLNGECLELYRKLPEGRRFLLTGDDNIRKKAKELGFELVETKKDLEDRVDSIHF